MSILARWLGGRGADAPEADAVEGGPATFARKAAGKLVDLANEAEDRGDLALALTRIREAIEIDPHYPRAQLNLGNVLLAGGDLQGAMSATSDAVRLDPQYAAAHYNLGRLHGMTGDDAAAEACFAKALQLRPQFPLAAVALATQLEKTKRTQEAQTWMRRALGDDPRCEAATLGLSRLLHAEGNHSAAELELQRAIDITPESIEVLCALGDLCYVLRRRNDAIGWFTRALEIDNRDGSVATSRPILAQATLKLGLLLVDENRWAEAVSHLRRAMELLPQSPLPYVKLAFMEMLKARPTAALELLQRAIERDPAAWNLKSFRLFLLNLRDDIEPQELFTEHRRVGEWLEGTLRSKAYLHSNSVDAERRLRVGYISADYRVHPVMIFISPVLEEHDLARVQPFCYSNTVEPDETTGDLKQRFAGTWRDITTLGDDEVADLIVEDEIDILVDLSGHTDYSRLPVFARKPAPIQVSWLGYLNTTGLKAMDYRLVDRFTDPVGPSEALHTERLERLPDSQWAYWPIIEVPIVRRDRPSESREIVFGSFNQFMKLSDRTLDLWGRILARLPEARLRVAGLPPGDFEELLLQRLQNVGIAETRVEVARRVPIMQYLRAFNEVDIAFDSMPYNGATTTLDTLWMGVPVVALAGARSLSRGTFSILKTLEMTELIAETAEHYVELNVRLASDAEWRRQLHRSLRDKLRRSPLMDIAGFTENLEAAYRRMWREWCESQHPADPRE